MSLLHLAGMFIFGGKKKSPLAFEGRRADWRELHVIDTGDSVFLLGELSKRDINCFVD